jgi:hypothetical protein
MEWCCKTRLFSTERLGRDFLVLSREWLELEGGVISGLVKQADSAWSADGATPWLTGSVPHKPREPSVWPAPRSTLGKRRRTQEPQAQAHSPKDLDERPR